MRESLAVRLIELLCLWGRFVRGYIQAKTGPEWVIGRQVLWLWLIAGMRGSVHDDVNVRRERERYLREVTIREPVDA